MKEICGKEIPFIKADAGDVAAMRALFAEYQIDAAIHFAGHKAVGESVAHPLMYYRNNYDSALTILEMCLKHGSALVFSSSATVYGVPHFLPLTEDHPLSAVNPYGRTKLYIEETIRDVALAHPEFNVSILRYFNPVGAHESGLIGENPNGIPNNLMPFVCQTAAGIRKELQVFGDDYDTPDGTGVRDYPCDRPHLRAHRRTEKAGNKTRLHHPQPRHGQRNQRPRNGPPLRSRQRCKRTLPHRCQTSRRRGELLRRSVQGV